MATASAGSPANRSAPPWLRLAVLTGAGRAGLGSKSARGSAAEPCACTGSAQAEAGRRLGPVASVREHDLPPAVWADGHADHFEPLATVEHHQVRTLVGQAGDVPALAAEDHVADGAFPDRLRSGVCVDQASDEHLPAHDQPGGIDAGQHLGVAPLTGRRQQGQPAADQRVPILFTDSGSGQAHRLSEQQRPACQTRRAPQDAGPDRVARACPGPRRCPRVDG